MKTQPYHNYGEGPAPVTSILLVTAQGSLILKHNTNLKIIQ